MAPPTAFIIDDEPGIAQVALDVAIDCGYNARIATSGAALDAAADTCDVILLDLIMPGMDGVEVLRNLAAAGSRAQIILMSGMDRRMLESARKVAAMQNLRVAGVLNKPFRPAELRDLLTGLIANTNNAVGKKMGTPQKMSAPQVVLTVKDLADAIAHDELVIHYQPKLNLADQSWIGVEALVRWQHPVHGLLYPDAFVHLAEGSELALPFTYEVARKAVADCAVMIETMNFEGSLAINIPPSALTEATVPERLLEILSGSALEPSRLVVEITETSIPSGLALSLDIQTRLRMRGIRLSIDDFGTGHSSLERLHEAPFDELKIDMMFVRGAEHDPALRMIAESAVKLGHSLGMVVTAEGVENAEALAWLTRIGCDYAQGYHISRPLPLDGLGKWAKKASCASTSIVRKGRSAWTALAYAFPRIARTLRTRWWKVVPVLLLLPILVTVIASTVQAQTSSAAANSARFTIGVLPNVSARIILNNYQPMRAYFERVLGMPVDIATGLNFQDFSSRTFKGEYDLIITAPNLGRVAQMDALWDPLAIYEPKIPALLVSLKTNTNDQPQQVRGKAVAMANPQSLVALLARRWLAERQLVAEVDYKTLIVANDDSLGAVLNSGEAPLAVMSMGEYMAKTQAMRDTLRIVREIDKVPGFFVMANPKLATDKRKQLQSLILALPQAAEGAEFFNRSGFKTIRKIEPADMSFLDPFLGSTRQDLGLKP